MEEKFKFSVSMCVYCKDDPEWFRTAVESIMYQTLIPDEVVLVVDGPIGKDLEEVILEFEKLDIFKVIWLKENKGHGNARRTGLENCSNELVALMDADDISLPDRFEKQIKVFKEEPELSIVGGNISEFAEEPENILGFRTVPQKHEEITEYLKKRCPMNQVTVMFKKTDVQKAGGYIDWFCNEDYYLWNRMFLAGMKFTNVPEVLVNVRVGKEMYQRRGGKRYFESEYKLQKFMLKNKIIGFGDFCSNVAKRFVVQVLLPNKIRGWVFKKFARSEKVD